MYDLKADKIPTVGDFQTHFIKDPMLIVKKFAFNSCLKVSMDKKAVESLIQAEKEKPYDWKDMLLSDWEKDLVYEYVADGTASKSHSRKRAREDEESEPHETFPENPMVFALDCEMILTEAGSELARVSVVSKEGMKLIYDEFIKPSCKVLDYKTEFSGITEELLTQKATKTLADAQKDLLSLAPPAESIIVGHSIENDLKSLQLLDYQYLIDTSVLYSNPSSMFRKPGLKWLAVRFLDRDESWQNHDSYQDALATLELAILKRENGASFGREKFYYSGHLIRMMKSLELANQEEQKQIVTTIVAPSSEDRSIISQVFPDLEIKSELSKSDVEMSNLFLHFHDKAASLDSVLSEIYASLPKSTLLIVADSYRDGFQKDLEKLLGIGGAADERVEEDPPSNGNDENNDDDGDGWTLVQKKKKPKTGENDRKQRDKDLIRLGNQIFKGKALLFIK